MKRRSKICILIVIFALFVGCSGNYQNIAVKMPREDIDFAVGIVLNSTDDNKNVEKISYSDEDIKAIVKTMERISYDKDTVLTENDFDENKIVIYHILVASKNQEEGISYLTDGKTLGVIVDGNAEIYKAKGVSPLKTIERMEHTTE